MDPPDTLLKDDVQNGVKRPRCGTICRRVWDISDAVRAEGYETLRKEVMKRCLDEGLLYATVSMEHNRWRRFNGITRTIKRSHGDEQPTP